MRKVRIAQVGAYNPKSIQDISRHLAITVEVVGCERDFFGHGIDEDIVNLNYGRDFLTERRKYDLVIAHSIFTWKYGRVIKETNLKPADLENPHFRELSTSRHHNKERWLKRLAACGARYIGVCEGQPAAMSGWELGDIAGYEILKRDHLITVYRRQTNGKTHP